MIFFLNLAHIVLLAELLLSLPLLFSVRPQSIANLFPVEKPFILRPNASCVVRNLPVVLGGEGGGHFCHRGPLVGEMAAAAVACE